MMSGVVTNYDVDLACSVQCQELSCKVLAAIQSPVRSASSNRMGSSLDDILVQGFGLKPMDRVILEAMSAYSKLIARGVLVHGPYLAFCFQSGIEIRTSWHVTPDGGRLEYAMPAMVSQPYLHGEVALQNAVRILSYLGAWHQTANDVQGMKPVFVEEARVDANRDKNMEVCLTGKEKSSDKLFVNC